MIPDKREKLLAVIVGLLATLMVAYFAYGYWSDTFETRERQLETAHKNLRTKQAKVAVGSKLIARRAELEKRSLPSNKEIASSQYHDWLLVTTSQLKLQEPVITPQRLRSSQKHFQKLGYTITAKSSLDQLTRLLYTFYSTDHLHQIRALNIKQIDKSPLLDVTMTVEAMILPGADRKDALAKQPGKNLELSSLKDYQSAIVDRNLFAEYMPPKPAVVEATRERPKETPKPPSFDVARLAYVSSIVIDVEGRPQVWLNERNTNKTTKLFEGDKFEVGEVKGEVLKILFEQRQVEVRVDGKSLLLSQHKSIGETVAEQKVQ
ncbi:MAG: hypothetical protein SGJ20_16425 [Planctomycetota bacterium]|nr:hypothetical protein [Planctomycetota bacterium]